MWYEDPQQFIIVASTVAFIIIIIWIFAKAIAKTFRL